MAVARLVAISALVLAASAPFGLAAWNPNLEYEGLPEAPGREETFYNCIACHSTAIIQQQRHPRDRWDIILNWMVEDQGMDPLDQPTRSAILDYLAQHFGPSQ